MKIVKGERVGFKMPAQNCAGCINKVGNVCSYYKAILQSNPHRPNTCKEWKHKPTQEGM